MNEYFEQTDNKLYDKHYYKLVYTNGKSKKFDDYYSLREEWHISPNELLDFVEVLDKKEKKPSNGFK